MASAIPRATTPTPPQDPFIAALHGLDRRAEKSLAVSLSQTHEKPTSLRRKIWQIRDIHPELTEPLMLFLKQFPSLTLACQGQQFPVPLGLVPELSAVLSAKVQERWEVGSKTLDLSDYSPDAVALLLDIFTGKEVSPEQLLAHAQELLSLIDLWQFDKISQELGALDERFLQGVSVEDVKELIASAKRFKNILFYTTLLQSAVQEASHLEPEDQALLADPLFKQNVSQNGLYVWVKMLQETDVAIYQKLAAFVRSPSGGKLAIQLGPNFMVTRDLLGEVQAAFERFGFPEKLTIGSRGCNVEALKQLLASTPPSSRLQSLELSGLQLGDDVIELLPRITSLQELSIIEMGLTSHSAIALGRYLEQQTQLETLSLEKNGLSATSCGALLGPLQALGVLRRVSFADNQLNAQAPAQLRDLIAKSPTLQELNLSRNPIQDEGARQLAAILQKPHALEELRLANCAIGDEGIEALVLSQIENPLLYTLDLSSNPFTSKAIQYLCSLLEAGITLFELDLSHTAITDQEATRLAKSLKNNRSLHCLNLSYTEIGNEAAMAFADLLAANPTLHTLRLMKTKVNDEGADRLFQTIQALGQFQLLQLSYTEISDACHERISQDPRVL